MNKLFKLDRNFTKGIPPPDWSRDQESSVSYSLFSKKPLFYWIGWKVRKIAIYREFKKHIESPSLYCNLLNVTRQWLTQQRVNNWSSWFSIFLRDMTWMLERHAFFALELLTLNEKKLSLVSSGESLVLIHELPNLNHQILIINHSVPWLNLTSLGKQSPFPYLWLLTDYKYSHVT